MFLLKGLDNIVVSAYHSFQVDMAILYGADKDRAVKDMREALDFEIGLANVRQTSFLERLKKISKNLFIDFASNGKKKKCFSSL